MKERKFDMLKYCLTNGCPFDEEKVIYCNNLFVIKIYLVLDFIKRLVTWKRGFKYFTGIVIYYICYYS